MRTHHDTERALLLLVNDEGAAFSVRHAAKAIHASLVNLRLCPAAETMLREADSHSALVELVRRVERQAVDDAHSGLVRATGFFSFALNAIAREESGQ